MSRKAITWIIIILLLIGLIAVIFFIAQEYNKTQVQQQPGAGAPSGIAAIIANSLPQITGWVKNLFGGSGPNVVDCDPNRPGYEKDGTYNANCGKDYTGCQKGVCDPGRPGYDKCGLPDINCGFGG